MSDDKLEDQRDHLPAIFATIRHQSDRCPNGYTDDEIAELNELANKLLPEDEGLVI